MTGTQNAIAAAFVSAQVSATALTSFPGPIPGSLDGAYAIQAHGIAMHPGRIAGWKVAKIPPAFQSLFDDDRLIGPMFADMIVEATPDAPFPIISGGAGALEAEIVLRLSADAPDRGRPWTAVEVRELVDTAHIGVEIAGSPLATCSALGPVAMVCGLGNNMGLILGGEISDWRHLAADVRCTCTIDGEIVGARAIDRAFPDPLAALAFAANQALALKMPLRRGQLVSTGAITGAHPFLIGQQGIADFGSLGRIICEGVVAQAVTACGSAPKVGPHL